MSAEDFTQHPAVQAALQSVRERCAGSLWSDVVDGEGHQYVDLVMEGGGVLGISLVGYSWLLEQAGIRFLGVGGTSAGSINALMLAAAGAPAQARSARLVEVLAGMPIASFVDGDGDARDFSRAVLGKASMPKLLFKGMQVMDNLREDLGLNPGLRFQQWLQGELDRFGVRTLGELDARLSDVPADLALRSGEPLPAAARRGRLAMVAADVTTETKAEFPKMAELYWQDPQAVPLACFARASMSIPFFFHPFRVDGCPAGREDRWRALAGYAGEAPRSVLFIDGGIMSNFPIDLFHRPLVVPRNPTFGAKIGVDRGAPVDIRKPAQLLGRIFNAARHTLDFDFIVRNPDYAHLVAAIDPGEHNWLDFDLPLAAKVDLFRRGAEAAATFLCGFDWARYKEVRRALVVAHEQAQPARGSLAARGL